jgi:very-short-patch-repair endonuclease
VSTTLGKLHRQQFLAAHAHRMRRGPSEPERVLWAALRSSQQSVRFRRQVVLAGYIVDFFAEAQRLVVEVDGAQHALRRNADKRRDRALAALGLRVLRLPTTVVTRQSPLVLQLIAQALHA